MKQTYRRTVILRWDKNACTNRWLNIGTTAAAAGGEGRGRLSASLDVKLKTKRYKNRGAGEILNLSFRKMKK